jgi:hypothetical protein
MLTCGRGPDRRVGTELPGRTHGSGRSTRDVNAYFIGQSDGHDDRKPLGEAADPPPSSTSVKNVKVRVDVCTDITIVTAYGDGHSLAITIAKRRKRLGQYHVSSPRRAGRDHLPRVHR